MASSIARPYPTSPDNSLVTGRPAMAKATLDDNGAGVQLSSVVKDTAKRVYGKQGAAAAQLGKDEGNFARDVVAGRTTLADLGKLGPQFLAELGRELVEQYAPLSTPQARARQQIKVARQALEELEQVVELIA